MLLDLNTFIVQRIYVELWRASMGSEKSDKIAGFLMGGCELHYSYDDKLIKSYFIFCETKTEFCRYI